MTRVRLGKRARRLSPMAVMLGFSATAGLAAAPTQADICVGDKVDRERLALFALTAAGVSRYPERWIAKHPADYPALTPAQAVLVGDEFCKTGPDGKFIHDDEGFPICAKDDPGKIGDAQNSVINVLTTTESYGTPAGIVDAESFFATPVADVACLKGSDGKPRELEAQAIPSPFKQEDIPIRLRGSTDGLQFDRNRDKAFAGVDKASITFKDDDENKKETLKGTLIAGYAIPVVRGVFEVVPYFGLSIDTSKKDGQAREVSDDVARIGTLLDFRNHGSGIAHLFLLRPEFARNRKEKSEVISANFSYLPIVPGTVNDAINITTGKNQSLLSIIPRFDLRFNIGDFIKSGSRTIEESRSFTRLGGQLGVTITSDVKWLPVELTVTETYLASLTGKRPDVSYLKAVFSLYFDENKYFGVDLGYARGRREDLVPREANWTIGFGAKF